MTELRTTWLRASVGIRPYAMLTACGFAAATECKIRKPDPVGALDASVIFGFQSGKSSTKFVCVLQIGRKRIRLYATNTVHIAHVRIFRIDNPPGIVKKGACLFSKRIKAANQMIASSVA